jgi:hypothetical protein
MALPAPSGQIPNTDLIILQGSDFQRTLTVSDVETNAPIDLTGATVEAKVRDNFGTTSNVLATFTAAITDAPNGQATISLTAAQTAALVAPAGTQDAARLAAIGFWDLEFTEGGFTYRYAQGNVTLSREVTK